MTVRQDFGKWEKTLPRAPLIDRDTYIVDRCSGRRVAHLGACDAPMTEDKAIKGELLHQKLQNRCESLVGYDLDAEAVRLLRERFAISDIVVRDLSLESESAHSANDLVICADIIEHVNNVGHLLRACNRMLERDGAVLISTINALSIKQAFRALIAREPVHPDHVAYFSFATLGVVVERFGFEMTTCRYFKYPTIGRISEFVFDALYRWAPQTADGILIEARKVSDA